MKISQVKINNIILYKTKLKSNQIIHLPSLYIYNSVSQFPLFAQNEVLK